jgi:hypothetical protein
MVLPRIKLRWLCFTLALTVGCGWLVIKVLSPKAVNQGSVNGYARLQPPTHNPLSTPQEVTVTQHSTQTLSKNDLTKPHKALQAEIKQAYGKLPLSFEVNQGQADADVKFLSRGNGYSLFLTNNEAVLALKSNKENSNVLRMQLIDSNPKAELNGIDPLPGKSNYFIGQDSDKWHTNLANYKKVEYKEIYPGIDAVYYGNQSHLEYDFVVAPNANPTDIKLGFKGSKKVQIDKRGNLLLYTEDGIVRQNKPLIYQNNNGSRQLIEGRYSFRNKNQIGFNIDHYDRTKPLIIDPTLEYSTFLGGDDDEQGISITVDSAGFAYVTGSTESTNFPTKNPYQPSLQSTTDIFITKLTPNGSNLVFSTFLGGNSSDNSFSIAIDPAANIYVGGGTISSNFPTLPGSFQTTSNSIDGFVVKLNSDGNNLLYSTYFGGSATDYVRSIAVDVAGNAYLTGSTSSNNFPTQNPIQSVLGGSFDAFAAKLNSSGSALLYSTYIGGSDYDEGWDIDVDLSGKAVVVGATASANFPKTGNALVTTFSNGEGFVTKLNSAGTSFIYSTFLGGNSYDVAYGIAVDNDGNAYVTGVTTSDNFPTTLNAYKNTCLKDGETTCSRDDAYVTKINSTGSELIYSTLLGGSDNEVGYSIAVDNDGNAYVAGQTESTDFPLLNAVQSSFGGDRDTFVTKLNLDGSALLFSTYINIERSLRKNDLSIDGSGNIYVAGENRSTFITTEGAFQTTNGGGYDAYIVKLNPPTFESTSIQFSSPTYTVNENGTTATITVERTGISSGEVSVDYSMSDLTAINGTDYIASTGTINFVADEITKSFTVELINDPLSEEIETIKLMLSNPTGGAALGSQATVTLSIVDDDPLPTISINDVTVDEVNSGTVDAVFTVSLSTVSGQTVVVDFSTANGSATAGSDYLAVNGTLIFGPGEISKSIIVPVNGDTEVESDETLFVNLTNPSNATIAKGQGKATIIDNDSESTLQFSSATYSANENDGTATITVTRTGSTNSSVSVHYIATGTGQSGTVTFSSGETTKTFTILIVDDVVGECDELINLKLENPTGGAKLGEQSTATLDIVDDDIAIREAL